MKDEIFILLGIGIVLFLVMRKPQKPVEPEPFVPEPFVPEPEPHAEYILYGSTLFYFPAGIYTLFISGGTLTRTPYGNTHRGTICFRPDIGGQLQCSEYASTSEPDSTVKRYMGLIDRRPDNIICFLPEGCTE